MFSKSFLIPRISERDTVIKYNYVFMYSTRYFCQILMKLKFSRPIYKQKLKFHENSSSGSLVVPYERKDGQTNRHDEANMGRLNSLLGRHTENPKWMEVADHLVQSNLW
jgi:hypothetical protein